MFRSYTVHLFQKTTRDPNLHYLKKKKVKIERYQHTIKHDYDLAPLCRQMAGTQIRGMRL
jgi:hypothetical protein